MSTRGVMTTATIRTTTANVMKKMMMITTLEDEADYHSDLGLCNLHSTRNPHHHEQL